MSLLCRDVARTASAVVVALVVVCGLTWGYARIAAPTRTLRVCADPNNLPFSNDRLEGFENRIASLIAEDLHARVEYLWWPQRRGFVRHTLGEHSCDVMIGVPTKFELVATTKPYYRSTYVFVTRRGGEAPTSLDDPLLSRALVGVHLIGDDGNNSPPAQALARRGIVANVRGYSIYGNYREPNPPAALVRAVATGALDVAVVWGPLAGYFAPQSAVPLTLAPVTPQDDAGVLPFAFDISMGVRREDRALRDELNEFITRRGADLNAILSDYHVPRADRDHEVDRR